MIWLILILLIIILMITLYFRFFKKVTLESVNDLIHKTGFVLTSIGGTPLESGSVRLNHDTWPAIADVPISKGTKVQVIAIEGIRLIVRPISE